jgi:prepilin-type N-terminal cleavage/methylation domain-containing protein
LYKYIYKKLDFWGIVYYCAYRTVGETRELFCTAKSNMTALPPKRRYAAFSLIELLVVIAIICLLVGISFPAIGALSKSNHLNTAARLVNNLLHVARSEAINQGTYVQLRIATKWATGGEDQPALSYRKMSLWRLDRNLHSTEDERYVQISKWETLPVGIMFEPSTNPAAAYSLDNPGTYLLSFGAGDNNSKLGAQSGNVTFDTIWIEFTPSGAARFDSKVSNVYLLLVQGVLSDSSSTNVVGNKSNWAQTRVTTLTGKIQTIRP